MSISSFFDYFFHVNPPMRAGADQAQRSAFLRFQTYPQNRVQGGSGLLGTLVMPDGVTPGSFFRAYQPPQAYVVMRQTREDMFAGGTPTGQWAMQPLIDTSHAQG